MPIAAALPFIATAATVAGSISSISASRKAANVAQDAAAQQRSLAGTLQYQPIDIEKLKRDATAQAIQNATQSLALERALQPDVAATRESLARSVNTELQQGSDLPPDIANRVAMAARTASSRTGSLDTAAPVTASLIGLTSLDLLRSRQNAAANLLSANPLQPTGLDPGTVASAEVAQNAAQNQFNLEKAGVSSNLINSQASADGAKIAANAAIVPAISSGIAAIGKLFAKQPTSSVSTGSALPTFNYTMPKTNYSLLGASRVT